jgi:hypothetical protein
MIRLSTASYKFGESVTCGFEALIRFRLFLPSFSNLVPSEVPSAPERVPLARAPQTPATTRLLRAGHPDVEGLCLALADWSAVLRLLQGVTRAADVLQG